MENNGYFNSTCEIHQTFFKGKQYRKRDEVHDVSSAIRWLDGHNYAAFKKRLIKIEVRRGSSESIIKAYLDRVAADYVHKKYTYTAVFCLHFPQI